MRKSLNRQGFLSERGNKKPVDYNRYCFVWKEWILYSLEGVGIAAVFAYFFYRSVWAVIPLLPLVYFFIGRTADELALKRRRKLVLEFRDAILSAAAAMQAGYSVENAFREAQKDMEALYGKGSLAATELSLVNAGVASNIPLERLLMDLGSRSGESDIEDFAQIFTIAKRSGGNLNDIIRRCASVTADKIEVKREIHTLLTSKKYEQMIMNLIPFGIMLYIQATSKGFFDVLYGNTAGILIMTGAMCVYLAAYVMSERIIQIEV